MSTILDYAVQNGLFSKGPKDVATQSTKNCHF